jgi:hypothetical protein
MNEMIRMTATALAGAMLLAASGSASAQLMYSVTFLDTLGGPNSSAHAVNNSGQVVGFASPAYIYHHATMAALLLTLAVALAHRTTTTVRHLVSTTQGRLWDTATLSPTQRTPPSGTALLPPISVRWAVTPAAHLESTT